MKMPEMLAIRLQSKFGRFQFRGLSSGITLGELQISIKEKTKLEPEKQKILTGYPPREIVTYDPTSSLLALGIQSGDTVTVEEVSATCQRTTTPAGSKTGATQTTKTSVSGPSSSVTSCSATEQDPCDRLLSPGEVTTELPGMGNQVLTRRVVPADNSCLFRSVSILLSGGSDSCDELRSLAAAIILSNSDRFTAALLGKENGDYVEWLQRKESWGGAIELMVFSEHFQVELDVLDIQTLRMDRFGEDRGYSRRAFLLYDGIHYDPLVKSGHTSAADQSVFPVADKSVENEARLIARNAHQERKFTDLSNFSIRCLVCHKLFTGQTDAMTHATQTGHSNFGEVAGK